jgi:hypothetical protein
MFSLLSKSCYFTRAKYVGYNHAKKIGSTKEHILSLVDKLIFHNLFNALSRELRGKVDLILKKHASAERASLLVSLLEEVAEKEQRNFAKERLAMQASFASIKETEKLDLLMRCNDTKMELSYKINCHKTIATMFLRQMSGLNLRGALRLCRFLANQIHKTPQVTLSHIFFSLTFLEIGNWRRARFGSLGFSKR